MTPVRFLDLAWEQRSLRNELMQRMGDVVDAGRFVLGAQCEAFEAEWAEYCGVAHAVGVGSGLSAIELLLRAHGVGPGDEVLVPSYTFIATWLAVVGAGATVAPVDVDPDTGNIDPGAVEAAVTPRTAAIIAVHLFGVPAPMEELQRVARRHSLLLLEDAAQAHGARFRGRRCGGLADGGAFSFYPTKNLGALGDAGAVTTDAADVAAVVRSLRNYGTDRLQRRQLAGTNSRLDELQAAVLRVKLRHLDRWNASRRAIAAVYTEILRDTLAVVPQPPGEVDPSWHIYSIRHRDRDRIRRHLAREGIETKVYYRRLPHEGSPFIDQGPWGPFPVASALGETSFALPCHPSVESMSRSIAERVQAKVTAVERLSLSRSA
jgi:dTDP-4-amino-4,6-dideoxygalactose transaminase